MTDGLFLSGGARRRRWPRLLAGAGIGAIVVVAVLALVDPATIRDRSSRDSARPAASKAREAEKGFQRRASRKNRRSGGGDASRFVVSLARPDAIRLRFVHRPWAGLMFDVRTGRVLWRRNPTRRLRIASLTKMMTALLVVEREGPHERVKITNRAAHTPGSGIGVLPKGKKVQLEALVNGLLLVSGNDAAVALAQHSAGKVQRFVHLMNRRADELGLSCTRFSTPHGLLDRNNRSCAVDLAVLARADLAKRRIRRIARRDRAVLKFPIRGGHLFLYNNNPLVRSGYRGTTGLKTGYTHKSGRSLVVTVKRGRIELGVVLLRSYNPADQARKLLRRGFRVMRR